MALALALALVLDLGLVASPGAVPCVLGLDVDPALLKVRVSLSNQVTLISSK